MTEKKVVLVTGVGSYWGARVAARLVTDPALHVLGLDANPPTEAIAGLDFVAADIRNPVVGDLVKSEGVDTVCHLAFVESIRPNDAAFDLNVTGTSKLLTACDEAGVRKVVLKSSSAVYGARPSNPAFLTEDHALRGSKRTGTTRDLVEMEKFCSAFRWRAPEMVLTILRFASIVGPTAGTPMTRFLRDPWAPSLLGFDPRMQIIHEDDVVEALVHAVNHEAPGIYNVAAPEVLPLNKIRGLAGKPPVAIFHLFAYWGSDLLDGVGGAGKRYLPIEPDYLRYPWVADLRRMREELGFQPRYAAEETLREFAERYHAGQYVPGPVSMAREEEQLRALIEQRRLSRERQATTTSGAEEGEKDD